MNVGRLPLCERKTNIDEVKINFAEISWDESNVGTRSKAIVRNGRKLRLVEFASEFVEYDWCLKGHVGYVLDGELEVAFSDRTERFSAGDGLIIAGGENERHKAKVVGSVVKLVLVEEV